MKRDRHTSIVYRSLHFKSRSIFVSCKLGYLHEKLVVGPTKVLLILELEAKLAET